MRLSRLLPAAAAIVGIGAVAYAERPAVHVATYALPDGRVAHVRYTGDVAPRLVLVPTAEASPFAMLDRMAAMMDARTDALFAQVADMPAGPDAAMPAAIAGQPAGAHWTSVSRIVTNGRVCETRVSMTAEGEGRAPRLIRTSSGDCGAAAARPTPPAPPVESPARTVPHDSI